MLHMAFRFVPEQLLGSFELPPIEIDVDLPLEQPPAPGELRGASAQSVPLEMKPITVQHKARNASHRVFSH
jgi:hypothetical protein